MFKNQPKGLYVLALANTGERFGYYTMIAILYFFMQSKFALSTSVAGPIYSVFLALVYFMPMIGGIIADKWNFQKTVTLGIFVMFFGYLVLALPTEQETTFSLILFLGGLLMISCGTGLFKGNLQVMVGDLYNNPKYEHKRDVAFSLFYMAINIGAMFAPAVTVALCSAALGGEGMVYDSGMPSLCNGYISGELTDPDKLATLTGFAGLPAGPDLLAWCKNYMTTLSTGYTWAFAVACGSMVLSYVIFRLGRKTYQGVSDKKQSSGKSAEIKDTLTPKQTRNRIVALMLVFVVVIFFWMSFHQNGVTLTYFAQVFTDPSCEGATRIGFNIWALALIVVAIYATFSVYQSSSKKSKLLSALVLVGSLVGIGLIYVGTDNPVEGIQPQQYQQFNPFFVVALTPFSVLLFSWLAKKKKEPSAPRKIGYGMLVAGIGFTIMALCSFGLGVAPTEGASDELVNPNVLISTYLVLTFAELLLSPMGISFVSKVAPPKYKGMMMGCWFGATAIGNLLTSIPALLWNVIPVAYIWIILVALCLISAIFIFSIMKKLEAATSDAETAPAVDQLETVEDDVI